MAKQSQIKRIFGLTDGELADLVKQYNIPPEHYDFFTLTMSDEEWANIDKIIEAVRYKPKGWSECRVRVSPLGRGRPKDEGTGNFDAKTIMAQFFKKADENPIVPGEVANFNLICGEASLWLYQKNDPKTDLLFFISVFLKSGNNINKAVLRSDSNTGNILRRKVSAYGIVVDPVQNRKILGTKELTLSRIAQAFPVCTAAVIINQQVKGKLVSKLYGPNISLVMQHTIFAGLIPTGQAVTEELREIALVLNMEISMVLASPREKRKMAIMSVEDLLENSARYVDAAMNVDTATDKQKTKILIKAGVVTLQANGVQLSTETKVLVNKTKVIMQNTRMQYGALVEFLNIQQEPTADASTGETDPPN